MSVDVQNQRTGVCTLLALMLSRACVRPLPQVAGVRVRLLPSARRSFADAHNTGGDDSTSSSLKITKIEAPDWGHYKRDRYSDSITRKSFSYLVMGSAAAGSVSAGKNAVLGLLDTMNASADVLALANIEVDLNTIPEGAAVTVKWRGKPLFVRHRTGAEISEAEGVPAADLKDPAPDSARRKKAEWLVLLGVCTHLGCVPINGAGDYKGWFCPCHGSHYDVSGRIRKGPAPRNLEIPPYKFLDDSRILVGIEG